MSKKFFVRRSILAVTISPFSHVGATGNIFVDTGSSTVTTVSKNSETESIQDKTVVGESTEEYGENEDQDIPQKEVIQEPDTSTNIAEPQIETTTVSDPIQEDDTVVTVVSMSASGATSSSGIITSVVSGSMLGSGSLGTGATTTTGDAAVSTGVVGSGIFQEVLPSSQQETPTLEQRLEKVREDNEGLCKKSSVKCIEKVLDDNETIEVTIIEDDESGSYFDENTGTLYEYDKPIIKTPEETTQTAGSGTITPVITSGSVITGSVVGTGIYDIVLTGSILTGSEVTNGGSGTIIDSVIGSGVSETNSGTTQIEINTINEIPTIVESDTLGEEAIAGEKTKEKPRRFMIDTKKVLTKSPNSKNIAILRRATNSIQEQSPSAEASIEFRKDTRVDSTYGKVSSFDDIQVLTPEQSTLPDGVISSLLVGAPDDHLLFSLPTQITLPVEGVEDGTEIAVSVLHFGQDKYTTAGLSIDSNTQCDSEGNATLPGQYTLVENQTVTFYTCGASTFVVSYVGGATFDNFVDSSSLAKTITVPAGGSITDINVTIDFQPIDSEDPSNFGATQAYSNEVSMSLQSPTGTTISLLDLGTYTNNGAASRAEVTFDDAAGAAPTNLPVDGTFLPSQALSAFNTEDPVGDRIFTLSDSTAQDGIILFEASLEITDSASCGDGTVEGAEGCDDGNTTSGDGCSDSCLVEDSFACTISPPGAQNSVSCLSGICDQTETTPTCESVNTCGNNTLETGEQCDDGNNTSGDGCNALCQIEFCGDGTIDLASSFQTVFFEGFESDNGTTQTSGTTIISTGSHIVTYTNSGPNGRVQYGTNAQQTSTGLGALSIDATPTGTFTTNQVVFETDLTNYTNASDLSLRFDRTDHGDESQTQDIVEIRGSNTEARILVYDFNPATQANGTFRTITIDINNVLSSNNQNISSTFQVRFGQNDNFAITSNAGADGITIDNVSISGTNNGPDIDETCDDGNSTPGDGCDDSCQIESGYICNGEPSSCTLCGDGSIDGIEQCDDGNGISGDGCSSSCEIETDRQCTGAPSSCTLCTAEDIIVGTLVTSVGSIGQTISYSDFTNNIYSSPPIVIATPNTDNNTNNYPIPVITSVTTTSATIQSCVDAGDQTCDTSALAEDFSIFVIDTDKAACVDHIEAGTTTIATNGSDSSFSFGSGFTNVPYVFTTPQTANQGANIAAHAWVDDGSLTVNGGDFVGCVHQAPGDGTGIDNCTSGQPSETLGRVALDPVLFSMTGLQLGEQNISNSTWTPINFTPNYTQSPGVMVTQNSDNGAQDPQYAWARNISTVGAEIRYCEADAGGVCNSHTGEDTMRFSLDVSVCGNGDINTGETCDDNNTTPGDGCDASCQIESGYICLGEPSSCSICGNGSVEGAEQCDDGNTTPGDGCNASCQIDFCGNGTIDDVGGAGTILLEDFESQSGTSQVSSTVIGSGNNYTITYENTGVQGRIRYGLNTVQPNSSLGAVTLDASPTGTFVTNLLVFEVDLSTAAVSNDLTLGFDWSDHGDEDQAEDIVEIRGSNTDNRITIYDRKANDIGNGVYQTVSGLDIDNVLSTNSQNPSSTFQVRFNQNDNFSADTTSVNDGFTVDNVIIQGSRLGPLIPETCDDGNTAPGDGCDASCQIEGISNSSPTAITLSGNTLIENNTINQTIGTLTTTDSDLSDTHTYSFGCAVPLADEDFFSFSGSQLLAGTGFNFEIPFDTDTNNDYEVCILTDDGNGGTYEETFILSVLDEYEEICIYVGSGIVFDPMPVSNNGNIVASQTLTGWFALEDLNGSNTGYFTTLQIGGFNGALGNFMPATIAEIRNTAPIAVVSGSANANVQLDAALTSFIPFDSPITYLSRATGINNGVTGYYETSPTLRLTIPEYQAVDTYSATITYTLFEN